MGSAGRPSGTWGSTWNLDPRMGKAVREAQAEMKLEVLRWAAQHEGFGAGLCVPDDRRGSRLLVSSAAIEAVEVDQFQVGTLGGLGGQLVGESVAGEQQQFRPCGFGRGVGAVGDEFS